MFIFDSSISIKQLLERTGEGVECRILVPGLILSQSTVHFGLEQVNFSI